MSEKPPVTPNETVEDPAEVQAEELRECEALMDRFEQAHDLEALRAITQFSSKEERESSPRQPALEALTEIFKLLKQLQKHRALQGEVREVFEARYQRLSQAVGNIIGDTEGKIFDIVVHDRRTPFPS